MTKVEKSPCFELRYEWEVGINHEEPHFYTRKFTCEKTEMLRVGMKTAGKNHSSSNPVILFLLTTNLQKMGLKVLSVSFYKRENGNTVGRPWSLDKLVDMEQKDLKTGENDDAAGIQLFTSHLKFLINVTSTNEFVFRFRVYFTGIVDNYRVQQLDGLMWQQLWDSVKYEQHEGDFKLIASDGKSLMVHKWVLAARSPVFADLFISEEAITSIHLAVDCTIDEMRQFILFIYTGDLDVPPGWPSPWAGHVLLQLAAKYRVKTLEDICQSALQDAYAFSADKMAVIAWHLDTGSNLICNLINE